LRNPVCADKEEFKMTNTTTDAVIDLIKPRALRSEADHPQLLTIAEIVLSSTFNFRSNLG